MSKSNVIFRGWVIKGERYATAADVPEEYSERALQCVIDVLGERIIELPANQDEHNIAG